MLLQLYNKYNQTHHIRQSWNSSNKWLTWKTGLQTNMSCLMWKWLLCHMQPWYLLTRLRKRAGLSGARLATYSIRNSSNEIVLRPTKMILANDPWFQEQRLLQCWYKMIRHIRENMFLYQMYKTRMIAKTIEISAYSIIVCKVGFLAVKDVQL